MTTGSGSLNLRFAIRLESESIPSFLRPHGPVFHRWLPNGRADAVVLSTSDESVQIEVWFERRLQVVNGFLKWDREGSDVDPEIMARQYKLDAGTLFGAAYISNITEAECHALYNHAVKADAEFGQHFEADDPAYVSIGKRVVRAIQPPLSRFVDTLRTQYGQYWLAPIPLWDSRRETLGHYCSTLGLWWVDEKSGDRYRFLPTNSGATFSVQRKPLREELEYLTEKDWRRIQRTPITDDTGSALQFLGLSHAAIDRGNVRQAFFEAGTAIELIVWQKLKRAGDPKPIEAAINGVLDRTPLPALVATSMRLSAFSTQDTEVVLGVIATRNAIVHDGTHPTPAEVDALRISLAILSRLMGLEEFKQPVLDTVNGLGPPGGARIRIGSE